MEYIKIDGSSFKEVETKTETRERVYKIEDLFLDEQNLLIALDKVRKLITEANKIGII